MPNWQRSLDQGKTSINEHLAEVSFADAPQKVDIDFIESQFRQIVEDLRLRIPAPTPTGGTSSFFNIWQNGLGHNNIIYMATVFGDLLKRRERFSYSSLSLIIEEPEAHLHPQLQDVLFAYLEKMGQKGIQVFLSSHSPTITAKTNLDALIALYVDGENVKSTPVSNVDLEDQHKRLLQRFMDVTKCQLFFAKSVILVEGISEALLLPAFARTLGSEFDLDRRGVEVVNICGVAFEPFARLFNSESDDKRLGIRCVVITDDDHTNAADGGSEAPSSRAAKARSLSGGLLRVVLAERTFEYELFLKNEDLVKSVYKELHPQTDLDFAGSIQEKAAQFADKILANRDKGIFAQTLAAKIDHGDSICVTVPKYIENAVRWAVRGEWAEDDAAGTH
jgi:putative ATP-dependent endonuclease of OLD family